MKKLSKFVVAFSPFLALLATVSAAPHTSVFWHEPKCPDELLEK